MVRIMPRETKFYTMFEDMAGNVTDGARLLRGILQNFDDVEAQVQKLPRIGIYLRVSSGGGDCDDGAKRADGLRDVFSHSLVWLF